jgi:hypothetical protein
MTKDGARLDPVKPRLPLCNIADALQTKTHRDMSGQVSELRQESNETNIYIE